MALLAEYSCQELLRAQLQLWHQSLGFFKSLALLIASDLRIADAIDRLGGAATLAQILDEAGIHPCRLSDLRRLMRVLTVSGIFGVHRPAAAAAADGRHGGGGDPVYKLTAASRLLIRGESLTSPFPCVEYVELMLQPCQGSPVANGMRAWFQQDQQPQPGGLSPFALAFNGRTIWERAEHDAAAFPFDNAMASDTAFLMPIVLKECAEVFQGLTSLVDVAGGLGGAAATIAAAFPDMKCIVLDLPQVVAKAPSGTSVRYVAGDMFESIPPANAVFLKWILHDWTDDECVKILKNCRQAIPPRDAGGKGLLLLVKVGKFCIEHACLSIPTLFFCKFPLHPSSPHHVDSPPTKDDSSSPCPCSDPVASGQATPSAPMNRAYTAPFVPVARAHAAPKRPSNHGGRTFLPVNNDGRPCMPVFATAVI